MPQLSACLDTARPAVSVCPLRENEVDEADRIMRIAFGSFLGLPEPETFAGDAGYVRGRWLNCQDLSFAAHVDARLAGSSFASQWGSVGYFGPITTLPSLWDKGIGQRLMAPAIEALDARGVRHVGLFTFAHSPKHAVFYQRFGFWPRFLTRIMVRPVNTAHYPAECLRFSKLPDSDRESCLTECRALTDALYDGLDLRSEIQHVHANRLGDTLLLLNNDRVVGFAIAHQGPGSEGGSRACLIKFATVQSGPRKHEHLDLLLTACEAYAADRHAAVLIASANTACSEACRHLLSKGFRIEHQGVAMHRPNDPGYYKDENLVLDDWR